MPKSDDPILNNIRLQRARAAREKRRHSSSPPISPPDIPPAPPVPSPSDSPPPPSLEVDWDIKKEDEILRDIKAPETVDNPPPPAPIIEPETDSGPLAKLGWLLRR